MLALSKLSNPKSTPSDLLCLNLSIKGKRRRLTLPKKETPEDEDDDSTMVGDVGTRHGEDSGHEEKEDRKSDDESEGDVTDSNSDNDESEGDSEDTDPPPPTPAKQMPKAKPTSSKASKSTATAAVTHESPPTDIHPVSPSLDITVLNPVIPPSQ